MPPTEATVLEPIEPLTSPANVLVAGVIQTAVEPVILKIWPFVPVVFDKSTNVEPLRKLFAETLFVVALIVLFVNVSVVSRPTSVDDSDGSVIVPVVETPVRVELFNRKAYVIIVVPVKFVIIAFVAVMLLD